MAGVWYIYICRKHRNYYGKDKGRHGRFRWDVKKKNV